MRLKASKASLICHIESN